MPLLLVSLGFSGHFARPAFVPGPRPMVALNKKKIRDHNRPPDLLYRFSIGYVQRRQLALRLQEAGVLSKQGPVNSVASWT